MGLFLYYKSAFIFKSNKHVPLVENSMDTYLIMTLMIIILTIIPK